MPQFSEKKLTKKSTIMKKKIEDFEFADNKHLTEYVIPDGVTEIGWCAFAGCTSLTSIAIPDSVTRIGLGAFRGCTGLTSITIPRGC